MREYSEHIARRAAIGVLVAAGVIAAATVALLFVFALAARPAHAQSVTTPPAGERDCLPGTHFSAPAAAPFVVPKVYLTTSGYAVEGGAVHWHCWTGTAWRPRSRLVHAQDIGAVLRAEFDRRIAQWSQTTTVEQRVALARQWDTSADIGYCDRHIANAGYAARLCRMAAADSVLLTPAALWQPPAVVEPPPPPPPAEVWTVAPNLTRADRPTFAWLNGQRATQAAVERAPVGSPCDPTVGRAETGGSYFGVLGRADRVALCRKQ
jgi:hypothetical protein